MWLSGGSTTLLFGGSMHDTPKATVHHLNDKNSESVTMLQIGLVFLRKRKGILISMTIDDRREVVKYATKAFIVICVRQIERKSCYSYPSNSI